MIFWLWGWISSLPSFLYLKITNSQEDYFTTAEGADIIENPFYASASSLFSDYVSGDCSRSLRDVSCGVCRSHEDSFVQSYTSLSEMRLCLRLIFHFPSFFLFLFLFLFLSFPFPFPFPFPSPFSFSFSPFPLASVKIFWDFVLMKQSVMMFL